MSSHSPAPGNHQSVISAGPVLNEEVEVRRAHCFAQCGQRGCAGLTAPSGGWCGERSCPTSAFPTPSGPRGPCPPCFLSLLTHPLQESLDQISQERFFPAQIRH